MNNFWMELQTIKMTFDIFGCRNRCIRCGSGDGKPLGQCPDGIAVAHPALCLFSHTGEDAFLFVNVEFGKSVFTFGRTDDVAAQGINHVLQAVADAQYRNAEPKNAFVHTRGTFGINTCRTARQDDTLRCELPDRFNADVWRLNLTVNMVLPYPAGNQLIVLRTKINDQNHWAFTFSFLMNSIN